MFWTERAARRTRADRGTRGGLTRYVVVATLARLCDGGAVVAVILLVTTTGGSSAVAGLLGACVTAPHVLGPFIARTLDTARDSRTVLSIACAAHSLTLAGAVLTYGHVPTAVTAALLVCSGLVGPILTGGVSAQLPAIAGPAVAQQRRAQGWDVATYGLAGTLGPSLVAALTAATSARTAGLVLASSALLAGACARLLPHRPPPAAGDAVPRPWQTLALIGRSPRLRRTLILTVCVALSVAVLPVVAVASTSLYAVSAGTAGGLVAAYGLGTLAGALGVMAWPPTGEADRLTSRLALVVSAGLAGILLAPSLGVALVTYALTGVANAFFFAATLAARGEYSPPEARGQVFVWVGALKITAGSAGTALAGVVLGAGVLVPVLAAVVLSAGAVVWSLVDRRATDQQNVVES